MTVALYTPSKRYSPSRSNPACALDPDYIVPLSTPPTTFEQILGNWDSVPTALELYSRHATDLALEWHAKWSEVTSTNSIAVVQVRECPTPCDSDCVSPCHEWHTAPAFRQHDPEVCSRQVRERLASDDFFDQYYRPDDYNRPVQASDPDDDYYGDDSDPGGDDDYPRRSIWQPGYATNTQTRIEDYQAAPLQQGEYDQEVLANNKPEPPDLDEEDLSEVLYHSYTDEIKRPRSGPFKRLRVFARLVMYALILALEPNYDQES